MVVLQIIDRRLSGRHKSAENKERLRRRIVGDIREAARDLRGDRSISDITKDGNRQVKIRPKKGLSEPQFQHGPGGRRETVHPGNKEFVKGDTLPRPEGGEGQGNQASDSGEGMDEFTWTMTKEEFLKYFFEDLELPDLVKTALGDTENMRLRRAGHSTSGTPSNLNIVRTIRQGKARKVAAVGGVKSELETLQQEFLAAASDEDRQAIAPQIEKLEKTLRYIDLSRELALADSIRAQEISEEMAALKPHIKRIPYLDSVDMRFNNHMPQPQPNTQAVVFFMMDVSGSMDEDRKKMAKDFFTFLYLLLDQKYQKVDIVFISHHMTAKECTEQEFFFDQDTGGTLVSSGLNLMRDIIHSDRYPKDKYNMYAAQASDGDNWSSIDSADCGQILREEILPFLQYYAYVEVDAYQGQHLWDEYEIVAREHKNFAMKHILESSDIYPVFRELFRKRGMDVSGMRRPDVTAHTHAFNP